MPRHSFIRMSKLPDVRGRIDYISNPERQEHLFTTRSTTEPEFWQHLSEQAQYDFWRSNQPNGKCIEARELIIALPESLQERDPDELLKMFVDKFHQEYGVECSAALHHNKTQTNYHIHLVFADRDVLEKTEVKYASRNMFFNEEGRHVRTKKEILDEAGNLRPKCKIIPKGEPYEVKWFTGRKDIFKSKQFLQDVKVMYTDLINQTVSKEEDRQQVFDAAGPYLPTKKIGKNNPLEAEIRAANELRQEWNRTVDQVLIAGGSPQEVTEFKKDEVLTKVSNSVHENGDRPGLFAELIRKAIEVLKEFLEILLKTPDEPTYSEVSSWPTENLDPEPKGPRPDSYKEELRFMNADAIHQQLNKNNRKLYALQKQQKSLQISLDNTPRSIFNRKERKAIEDRIAGIQRQIESTRAQLEFIPQMNGFASIKEAEAEYRAARNALNAVRRKQAEWDGVPMMEIKGASVKKNLSILKELARKQAETEERNQKMMGRKTERQEEEMKW